MDKSLERARKVELDVQKDVNFIFRECRDIIDYINEQKKKECWAGIECGFVCILIDLFLSYDSDGQYADELFEQKQDFIKILRDLIAGKADDGDIWRFLDKGSKTTFFTYCYFIKQSIFNCINIGYPGGLSYLEFVEDILRKNGISSTEQQRKKLSNSFKVYLSKLHNSKKDFIKIILSERMTHESVSDKNRGTDKDKYEFGPILLYERVAYEFEFFMRKKNQTKDMQTIMTQIDRVAKKKIEAIENCVFSSDSFTIIQNRYAKLAKKPIAKMTDGELREYREYIKLKRNYIRKYAKESQESSKYIYIEESKLFDDLLFLIYEDQIYRFQKSFDVIGRVLFTVIEKCGVDKKEKHLFWHALINLSYIIGLLMDIYTKDKTLYKPMIDLWYDDNLLMDYKENWSKIPIFLISKSEEKIQENFAKNLQENNMGLKDYLELCILTCNILPDEKVLSKLENDLIIVFDFLVKCKDKMRQKKDVTLDFTELNTKLGYKSERESLYNYETYRIYFQECVKTRYIRLFKIIHNEFDKTGKIDSKNIIEKYLDSIFFKYTDIEKSGQKEKRIPIRYRGELNQFLLSQLIRYLYPNHLSNLNENDIYIKKDKILCIADQYGFKKELGFIESD